MPAEHNLLNFIAVSEGTAVATAYDQEATMDTAQTNQIETGETEDLFTVMLNGVRVPGCNAAESIARALEVRRKVYVEGSGYDIPVPDEYDTWSWLLIAEDVHTGEAGGTMRRTPRGARVAAG